MKERNANNKPDRMRPILSSGIFVATLLLCAAMPAIANDGTYYTKGNQLVPLMETDISVRKEILTISLMDNGYARVDVYYEFWNPGSKTKRLLMGFEADPPYNDDYKFHPSGAHPNIRNFTVEMNGHRLACNTAACVRDSLPLQIVDTSKRYWIFDNNDLYEESNREDEDFPIDIKAGITFSYVYYFNADFQPGLNRVHHTYTYRMSVVVGVPYLLDYKLTPAARWAGGKIDDFTLIVCADSTAKHFVILEDAFPGGEFVVSRGAGKIRKTGENPYCSSWSGDNYEFALRNGAVQIHLTDFHPQNELRIMGMGYNECCDKKGAFHIGATYDRSEPIFFTYNPDKVVPADKAFLKRVVHNLPYAHRGHVFRDAALRRYFESLWWYMPDPNYKDDTSDFTETDWKYIHAEF